jgi:hypothetical protein
VAKIKTVRMATQRLSSREPIANAREVEPAVAQRYFICVPYKSLGCSLAPPLMLAAGVMLFFGTMGLSWQASCNSCR